jgi:hypothetical protein
MLLPVFSFQRTTGFFSRARSSKPKTLFPLSALSFQLHFGGGERNRTDDLLRARQALSQLSYTPDPEVRCRKPNVRNGVYKTLFC